jgi:hypothetical protein
MTCLLALSAENGPLIASDRALQRMQAQSSSNTSTIKDYTVEYPPHPDQYITAKPTTTVPPQGPGLAGIIGEM